ncbi:UPF0182 family protein [Phormidium sp. LEGE 05292]|uniref:UPF0182 family protein n=1 Tax=[Phormidium] sp. LEGE 05292 TaxID=767427 RepID=UPI001880C064|nr:UPF0182 family protein [Phormidium sp. LEGE 05292]MBE9224703.1 UPF0182 family protein [Phormidium sp. LEGE 05292]
MQSKIEKRESQRVFPKFAQLILWLLGLWLGVELLCRLIAEALWFAEVDYQSAFWIRLGTQLGLWTIALFSLGFLLFNLNIAERHSYPPPHSSFSELRKTPLLTKYKTEDEQRSFSFGLGGLLTLTIALSLLVGLLVFHYGKVAFTYWQPNVNFTAVSTIITANFAPGSIWQNLQNSPWWQLIFIPIVLIIIVIKHRIVLKAIAILISLSFGIVFSGQWIKFLQYFQAQAFDSNDPLFNRNIGFYVFKLPIWQLLEFWLSGLFGFGFIAVILIYLLSGNSLSEGKFPGFSKAQQKHLLLLGGAVMLCISYSYWLRRYELLYSTQGVVYGASFTDVTVQLPIYTLLSLVGLAIAILLFWRSIFPKSAKPGKKQSNKRSLYFLFTSGFILLFSSLFVFSFILPEVVQKLVVQPNEVNRERAFFENSIKLTREAFQLDKVEVETFNPQGDLSAADITKNNDTIRNIRLWDTRPLLETNRQLQQFRPYYKFPSADIDRYTLATLTPKQTEKRQVILAARELDYNDVPEAAKTWVNQHLVYTHGYGFTMSPVNIAAPGGLPYYFVKNIGAGTKDGNLQTSSPLIRYSIPTSNPRIYYGEISDTYVMTNTKTKELDYPSGDENVYNTYDGFGGIKIGVWWRKGVFAKYLNDWQMLLTSNITEETKILFRRNINERVQAIAPFLSYDNSPYLVVTDDPEESEIANNIRNHLYWIIDAYTTSDRYPYSDPGNNKFNYIRNSVKVVIDAYNGDVDFYVADPEDPIIKSLSAIFPKMFQPLSVMPAALRTHIRYPIDIYSIQSERLLAYHMTDPTVFYNREDLWQIPTEIYGGKPQTVEPYYLIMKLPTAKEEEFILLLPFTPKGRTNLIAWLAGRSDGQEYGRLLLYQFPKQQLVFGPEQIEALINQDPVISQQISLWNRQGSKAIQGNLLIIPIERSLLYVEPLYLEAEQNSVPTLVRVIVAYENRIVMAETLEQAIDAIFQPKQSTPAPIVRPVETKPEENVQ